MYYSKESIGQIIRGYLLDVHKIDVEQISHGLYWDHDTNIFSITNTNNPQVVYSAKDQIIFNKNDINIWLRSKKISNIKKRIN